jgi:hypothetical protein
MDLRRAAGERFTLGELGLVERPAFASTPLEAMESAQTTLALFHQLGAGEAAEAADGRDRRGLVRWRAARMESAAGFSAEWEVMRRKLDDVEPVLAGVRLALGEQVADPGGRYSYLFRGPALNFVAIREGAQVLADAVVVELQRGEPDRALSNLVGLVQLARQHSELYMLVNQMIRVAVTRLAVDTVWQALEWPEWNEVELAGLQSELEQLELQAGLLRCIEVERAMGLEFYELLKEDSTAPGLPPLGRLHGLVWRGLWSHRDLEIFLRAYQVRIDGLREANEGAAWVPIAAGLDQARTEEFRAARSGMGLAYRFAVLSAIALPNFDRAFDTAIRAETWRRMAVVAVALERFRVARGGYPDVLDVLVPEWLPAVPADPYVSRPLRYEVRPGERPRLWSVGANGVDDGGDWGPDRAGVGEGIYRIESRSLDEVWPAVNADEPGG